jgi:hypothetical protein
MGCPLITIKQRRKESSENSSLVAIVSFYRESESMGGNDLSTHYYIILWEQCVRSLSRRVPRLLNNIEWYSA